MRLEGRGFASSGRRARARRPCRAAASRSSSRRPCRAACAQRLHEQGYPEAFIDGRGTLLNDGFASGEIAETGLLAVVPVPTPRQEVSINTTRVPLDATKADALSRAMPVLLDQVSSATATASADGVPTSEVDVPRLRDRLRDQGAILDGAYQATSATASRTRAGRASIPRDRRGRRERN